MDLAGTEQAGACGWALNEGFKSGTTSKRESEMTKLFPNVSLPSTGQGRGNSQVCELD